MKVRSFLVFFSCFVSFFITSDAKQPHLASGDVKAVMNQLFDYHIDKQEMNTVLIERSLKIYLKQFDPAHAYLLQEETSTYISPSEQTLRKALNDYDKERLTIYFTLNRQIQNSITRAREWRRSWAQNPVKLVADAKKIKTEKVKTSQYVSSLAELQNRHYKWFLEFIAFQLGELKTDSAGKEAKVIALCEKQVEVMENDYLGVDDHGTPLPLAEQEHAVISRTLKALAQSLDAHTAYYSPDEAYAMKVQLEKGMCGIGVVLREGIDGIVIQDVISGGPAEQCGQIKKGDTIVEVDGKTVDGFSFHHVLDVMKGKEGSKMILGIVRNEPVPQFYRIELVRAKITLADQRVDVQSEPFGDGYIGKITLHSFYEGDGGVSSEKDLKKAIDELRQQGPLYGLVLDMRENSGGFLSQAVKVSGLFISCGVVVISKYSDSSMKYYRAISGTRYFDGPLVVLISRGSASATEIVAQALKDYGVAVVVGDEQTYGKGTIQHQTITSDGPPSFFKVTIGKYYSVSGKSTQIQGVKADIVVPSPYNFEEIGEAYLEYPLPADWVSPAYHDSLADIDPMARRWFQKYYLPTLQHKEEIWDDWISLLKENSERRLTQNTNFQLFLQQIKENIKPIHVISHGINDLQMEESVNILKDMILINQSAFVSS